MSQVPIGVPVSPPNTMPNVAEVSASVPAPTRPALSSSGAKASPVAGPPTRVTEPAMTPSSGCSPKPRAMAMPRKFCTKQNSDGEDEEDHDLEAAGPQQREAGAHADGAEEGDAQDRLRGGIELDAEEPVPAHEHEKREEQPAHHGRRNVESVEPGDSLAKLQTHEIEDRGEAQRLQQVELERQHIRRSPHRGDGSRPE